MDGSEFIVFLFFGYFTLHFLWNWYQPLSNVWPWERARFSRRLLGWLPVVSFVIIMFTLTVLAASDVVGSFFYILLYLVIGFAWLFFGLKLFSYFCDLYWLDDVVARDNRAALYATVGGFLGLTLIYSGANIGDGPGWWCVIFAGGLGLVTWLFLAMMVCVVSQVSERITVQRDVPSGIRFGFYLLASAILLARASAGDWTSLPATVEEFLDGWPVLLLMALVIGVERYQLRSEEVEADESVRSLKRAVFIGLLYVVFAVVSVLLLPPLHENPMYDKGFGMFGGGI